MLARYGASHCSSVASSAVVGKIRQAELRAPAAQRFDAQAQFARGLAPRQRIETEFAHRGEQRGHGVLRAGWHAAPLEHDRVEATFLERLDRARVAVPAHLARAREALGKFALESLRIERRGGEDQAVAAS